MAPQKPKVTSRGVPDRLIVAAQLFHALADKWINMDVILQNTSTHGTTRHFVHRSNHRPAHHHGDLPDPRRRAQAHRA